MCAWCRAVIVPERHIAMVIDTLDGLVVMHDDCAREWGEHLSSVHGITLTTTGRIKAQR